MPDPSACHMASTMHAGRRGVEKPCTSPGEECLRGYDCGGERLLRERGLVELAAWPSCKSSPGPNRPHAGLTCAVQIHAWLGRVCCRASFVEKLEHHPGVQPARFSINSCITLVGGCAQGEDWSHGSELGHHGAGVKAALHLGNVAFHCPARHGRWGKVADFAVDVGV